MYFYSEFVMSIGSKLKNRFSKCLYGQKKIYNITRTYYTKKKKKMVHVQSDALLISFCIQTRLESIK